MKVPDTQSFIPIAAFVEGITVLGFPSADNSASINLVPVGMDPLSGAQTNPDAQSLHKSTSHGHLGRIITILR